MGLFMEAIRESTPICGSILSIIIPYVQRLGFRIGSVEVRNNGKPISVTRWPSKRHSRTGPTLLYLSVAHIFITFHMCEIFLTDTSRLG